MRIFSPFLILTALVYNAKAFFISTMGHQDRIGTQLMSMMNYGNPSSRQIILRTRSPFGRMNFNSDHFIKDFVNSLDAWENVSGCEANRMQLDVKENENQYEVFIDVPGVNKEATKLEIKDHILTISTERKPIEASNEKEAVRRNERVAGVSTRSLRLPEDADEDQIQATFSDGVLHVTIKKLPEDIAKGVKTVPINYQ